MTQSIAVLAVALSSLGIVPAAAAPDAHDGTWAVELVTESGLCSAHYSHAVTIREGQVRPVSATGGARVSGRVGADGLVGLSVSGGSTSATGTGTGRLQAGSGSGTWKVSALCSGRWTARRSDGRTAQAE